MASEAELQQKRILIHAPTGRDSVLIQRSLRSHGLDSEICPDMRSLCETFRAGAGVAIVAEEAFSEENLTILSSALTDQPTWSDFPLIVLSGTDDYAVSWQTLDILDVVGNVTLLERPIQEITLVSAVRVALRSRQRQYQVRDHLLERGLAERTLQDSENRFRELAAELDVRVRQRTAELQRANKELEGFTYSIAHDLRSPLRRLMFSSEVIREDYANVLDVEGQLTLQELSQEAKKLSALVEDLLQFARLGQLSVRAEDVDFSQLARDVIEGIDCSGDIQFEVQEGLRTTADPSLLELVLENLVSNACKYMGSQAEPHIRIGFEEASGAYYVADNGIGFDMAFSGKLFQPFERLHRDTEYPGTGIGLANVKRIVERHGGQVWAQSKEGAGSTFYFTLCGATPTDSRDVSLRHQ